MFINKDCITITVDNQTVSMGQYLVSAKFGFHKLWDKNSGRNLAGSNTGTLIGIFPKITMQFRKLTKSELEYLAPFLDSAFQITNYYDPNKKQQVTMSTYSNDWEINDKKIITGDRKNEGFSWAVISNKRRS